MSFTLGIHDSDKTSVIPETKDDMFYVDLSNGHCLMIFGSKIRWFRDQLNKRYPVEDDPKPCEFCDAPSTTSEQDELGNDCLVCEEHAEMLASKKPERAADIHYDEQKDMD
jgi:hypothetical protein